MRMMSCGAALAAMLVGAMPALANNVGENGAWQFRSSADLANLAAVLDVIEKKRGDAYATPTTTTNIARQYNCGVSASATGNSGTQTALANSPTVTGATASAQGNVSDIALGGAEGSLATSRQANSGAVSSSISGGTGASVTGSPTQALNSVQTNGGTQSASISGSTACSFGALN